MRLHEVSYPDGALQRRWSAASTPAAASTAGWVARAVPTGGLCSTGMRSSVARRVAPLLADQLGVITSGQLRAAGVDLEVPRREGWLRLAVGLWVVGEPSDEQLLTALRLYAPGALASGALACRWQGLRYPPEQVGCHAVAPHGTTLLGGPWLTVHQTRHMPAAVLVRGHRLVPVARAVADAARWTTSSREARAVVLGALQQHRTTVAALEAERRAGALRSAARLDRALVDWHRGACSAPEAEAADAVLALARRAPPFLLNPEVRLDGVLLGTPDGWIPSAGIGWEMDSVEHHGSRDDLDVTLLRHQRFADAGLLLQHVTPSRFRRDERAWARDVADRARARSSAGWRPPHGLVVVPRGPLLAAVAAATRLRAA